MDLLFAALRLLEGIFRALKALLELMRSKTENEAHPARKAPPKHLKRLAPPERRLRRR